MAGHVVQSCHDRNEVPEESMQSYESVWMAHWKHPHLRSGNEAQNQSSVSYKSTEEHQSLKYQPSPSGSEVAADGSKFINRSGEASQVTKPKMINFMTESQTSSGKFRSEASKSQSFPMFKGKNIDRILSLKSGEASGHSEELRLGGGLNSRFDASLGKTENWLPSMLASPSRTETEHREPCFQPEGISWISKQPTKFKSNDLFEENTLASTPFQDDLLGSTSKTMPFQFSSCKTPEQSVFCREDEDQQLSTVYLFDEKRKNKNAALVIHDPSTSNFQLTDIDSKQIEKMPNHSDVEFFPNLISTTEVSKLEKLYHGSYALTEMPSSVRDVETMRICTTIDSLKKIYCAPTFSQTTHHFLFTKKKISGGGQMFMESTISTQLKGKSVSELLSLSPDFGFCIKKELKHQPLDSSTENEERRNTKKIKISTINSDKESSAETDTMDMNALRESQFYAVDSSATRKDMEGGYKSLTSQTAFATVTGEPRGKLLNTDLPDVNQVFPAVTHSDEDRETSTSRTQSLDVDCLLSHTENPMNSKSCASHDRSLGLDPCSRWVKRLKTNASDSCTYGTKSSKMGEASSHEKVNKFFSRILKGTQTSAEPKMSNFCGKEEMAIDQTARLLRTTDSSSTSSLRKRQDMTHSHAWIQRWCRNTAASPNKNPKRVVGCEPDSSKAKLDNFQRKQFPSIAAMALMGKAMTGFRPCQYRKSGSFVVWN